MADSSEATTRQYQSALSKQSPQTSLLSLEDRPQSSPSQESRKSLSLEPRPSSVQPVTKKTSLWRTSTSTLSAQQSKNPTPTPAWQTHRAIRSLIPDSARIQPLGTSQTWSHTGQLRGNPLSSARGLRVRNTSSPVQPVPVVVAKPQQSLLRRMTKKASSTLRLRKSSSEHDQRSGPVLMRNRNESGSGESELGIHHHDKLDEEDQDISLGQMDGPPTIARGSSVANPTQQRADGTTGIVVPEELQKGTPMIKVTRKNKTQRVFKLDFNSARVSWNPSKPSSRFYVDDMKDLRTGANARNYREELMVSSSEEDRWITVIYIDPQDVGKLKLLHVIAPSKDLFKLWTSTLSAIHRYRTEMMTGLANQGEKFVDAHWRNYMATQQRSSPQPIKEDKLGFEDVERLCRRLHVNCSRRYLKEKFKRADRDGSGYLNFEEFQRFVRLLKERDEVRALWEAAVVSPATGMSRDEFRAFLRGVQKADVNADSIQVDKVFRKFCRQSPKTNSADSTALGEVEDIHDLRMGREAFAAFLLSPAYNPALLGPTPGYSLDRPLNEYFCSSSHNTYLLGRQVRGESSVEGYIRVLQRGCRCVEIDCWDGVDGRPVVTHGHTGTSQCLFSDVITAVGKYAFQASPYPVILSLEVHCSLEQQIKMAESINEILAGKVVTEPYMTNSMILPSPQELKHRIIVKVKGSERRESSLRNDFEAMERKTPGASPRGSGFFKSNSVSNTSSSASESEDQNSEPGDGKKKVPKVATKIAHELGVLGVYCRGQKFRNFALPESKTFNHCFSFQEKAFVKFCKDPEKKIQLEKHNMRYLMRLYPSAFRVNSSNFDPLAFWRRGCQLVALNWQTYDLGLQLNEAMFASANDQSGYVLKPSTLRGTPADASDPRFKKEKKQIRFSIEVVSAQQLPRPKDNKSEDTIDPFVEVEVFSADDKAKGISTGEGGVDLSDSKGISGLGAPQKRRTKVVRDDGFHPLFKETMKFSLVTKFEDLVFVRFSVYHSEGGDDKSLMGTYTAKLISLQQGYRHLPLYDIQGEQFLFSTLFVKIDVDPMTLINRGEAPRRASTIESFKTTAKSVLGIRGFAGDRRSIIWRKDSDLEKLEELKSIKTPTASSWDTPSPAI